MRPAQVFISYRRDDSAGYARAVYDEMATHFGAERVFIDVDDIHAGQPFSEVIEHEVGASQVLLVLIGRRWPGERDGAPPRLGDPGDLVRREVAAGLRNGARVIPVLLDGAPMPTESQLPDELHALAGRQALEIGNSRYAADMRRLVDSVREALGYPEPPAPPPKTGATKGVRLAWAGGLMVVGLVVGGSVALWPLGKTGGASTDTRARLPDRPPDRPPTDAAPTRPGINGLWQAEVTYDWPNANHIERFDFRGDASVLYGTAAFLGVPRGVLEGRTEPGGLRFVTRTTEVAGGSSTEIVHRYVGRWTDHDNGNEIRFVMQTEGGSTPHAPVEFVARRLAGSSGR